jgi:predicted amidophosphoribosyltransferase
MPTNVTCPECDKEVTLTPEGACPNCGLDVAKVLSHDRHERAMEKMRRKREEEKPKKKDSGWW